MAYDGNGTFSPLAPPVFPAEGGEVIRADYFNQIINDLCQGLSNALTLDGQSVPIANLPMGNKRLTQLAAGVADTDAITLSQLNAAVATLENLISYIGTINAPTGTVAMFGGATAPLGWFECDGRQLNRVDWAPLFAIIGTAYGAGNGTTTFNIPDMRGEFARGWDHGRGVDAGRALGSSQGSLTAAHTHSVTDPGHRHNYYDPAGIYASVNHGTEVNIFYTDNGLQQTSSSTTGITIGSSGGAETRPRNVSFMFIIKA